MVAGAVLVVLATTGIFNPFPKLWSWVNTSPPIAPGIETDKIYNLSPTPTATLCGIPATVAFAALTPPLGQIYQFNVTIPANAPDGDVAAMQHHAD